MDISAILGIFVASPFLALIPAAAFGYLFVKCKRLVVLVAALGWLAYAAYEQAIKMRVLCSGECNIRVDLLLLYPLLVLFSLAGIYAYVRSIRSRVRS